MLLNIAAFVTISVALGMAGHHFEGTAWRLLFMAAELFHVYEMFEKLEEHIEKTHLRLILLAVLYVSAVLIEGYILA